MKRLSMLLVAASFLLTTPVSAQTRLSVMGGLNNATINFDTDVSPTPSYQPVTRVSGGLAATFPVSKQFGIQLGGMYSQKGGSLELIDAGATSSIEFDYIEFTLLGRVGFPLSGERVTAHLMAGPALAWQSSCKVAAMGEGHEEHVVPSDCRNHGLMAKDYDIGLAGGGGIGIGLTNQLEATLGVLYTHGLSNIDNTGSPDTLNNRALTFRAGFDFLIG